MAESLKEMVGFRNIAVHDYREIDFRIEKAIIERDFPISASIYAGPPRNCYIAGSVAPDLDCYRRWQV